MPPALQVSRHSIRGRLLLLLVAPVAAALVLSTVHYFHSFERPVREAYDMALSDAALALSLNVQVDQQGKVDARLSREALNLLSTDRIDAVYFRIDGPEGTALAGDADLPRAEATGANPAFSTLKWQGRPVRVVTYHSKTRAGDVVVTVAETLGKRGHFLNALLSAGLWSDVLEFIVILSFVGLGIRLALRPVDALAEAVAQRPPGDLSAIDTSRAPLEMHGLVSRLNSLLDAVKTSRNAEREFLESAAHQLRTPLTGVLAQLELLEAEETDNTQRARLRATHAAAARLSRTSEQLLALARAGHGAYVFGEAACVDLAEIATESLSAAAARAEHSGVDLGANLLPATVQGIDWLIAEALTNLIDNAITYTPAGGAVTVTTGILGASPFIEVLDSGTGIAAAERSRVVERFYRSPAARGLGSGLGLAIVADVAARHGAELTIRDGIGGTGTCIRMVFRSEPTASPTAAA